MAKFTAKQYAQALYDAVRETKDHDKVLDNFVKILAQNGDLSQHAAVEQEYKLLEMQEKGIHTAEITVAREINVNAAVVEELNKLSKSQTELTAKVDQGIVGGVVVRVDDTLIDASLKTQLNRLNQNLKS